MDRMQSIVKGSLEYEWCSSKDGGCKDGDALWLAGQYFDHSLAFPLVPLSGQIESLLLHVY